MSRQNLLKDVKGHVIQGFVADPAKAQVPAVSGGTLALSSLLDIPECVAIRLHSSADIVRYFNGDTTKTFPIAATDTPLVVWLDETITEVTLLGAATISIEAM
jgi:hypothetical protein